MPTFTVTIAGSERHDGEKPFDYIIDRPSAEAASAAVEEYHRREQDDDTVVLKVREGVKVSGGYNDLRWEDNPNREAVRRVAGFLMNYKGENPLAQLLADIGHYQRAN